MSSELVKQINSLGIGKLKDIARELKISGFSKYKSDTKDDLAKQVIAELKKKSETELREILTGALGAAKSAAKPVAAKSAVVKPVAAKGTAAKTTKPVAKKVVIEEVESEEEVEEEEEDEEVTVESLLKLQKPMLLTMAKGLGIETTTKMTKDELANLIFEEVKKSEVEEEAKEVEEDEEAVTVENLLKLGRIELVTMAKGLGIKVTTKTTKDDLANLIFSKVAEVEKDEEEEVKPKAKPEPKVEKAKPAVSDKCPDELSKADCMDPKKNLLTKVKEIAKNCGIVPGKKTKEELCNEIVDVIQKRQTKEEKDKEEEEEEEAMEKIVSEFDNCRKNMDKLTTDKLREFLDSKGIKSKPTQKQQLVDYSCAVDLNPRCDPENNVNCDKDQVCDVNNVPGVCIPTETADSRKLLVTWEYNGKKFIGSKVAINSLKEKLEKAVEVEKPKEEVKSMIRPLIRPRVALKPVEEEKEEVVSRIEELVNNFVKSNKLTAKDKNVLLSTLETFVPMIEKHIKTNKSSSSLLSLLEDEDSLKVYDVVDIFNQIIVKYNPITKAISKPEEEEKVEEKKEEVKPVAPVFVKPLPVIAKGAAAKGAAAKTVAKPIVAKPAVLEETEEKKEEVKPVAPVFVKPAAAKAVAKPVIAKPVKLAEDTEVMDIQDYIQRIKSGESEELAKFTAAQQSILKCLGLI